MKNIKFTESPSSLFAQMVDKLRNRSEAELKMLHLRFFQKEIEEEWIAITNDTPFENISEDDIIKAIQKNRYNK